jgi:SAM-dependent methyltransferase
VAQDSERRLAFGLAAEEYDLVRPGYPAALVDAVLAHCGGTGVTALEAGAGTGKATRAFAARGLRITAVEPDPAMAGILAASCTGYPEVSVVVGGFEEYVPGQPCGLLFSAQAWHWIDPAVRWDHAAAVLAAGGSLALFWNFDRIIDGAVQEEVTQAHRELTPHIEWDTTALPEDGLHRPGGPPVPVGTRAVQAAVRAVPGHPFAVPDPRPGHQGRAVRADRDHPARPDPARRGHRSLPCPPCLVACR